jgi:hypothetical protein
MELRCIKTYGAHWGIFYVKDKLYKVIEETTYEKNLIINYEEYWAIKVNIPYYIIGGEGKENYSFISISKNEIIQEFGSCMFDTTEKLVEDYFDVRQFYRDQKLSKLLD